MIFFRLLLCAAVISIYPRSKKHRPMPKSISLARVLYTTIGQRFFAETLYRIKSMPAGLTLIFRNWCIGTSIIFSAVVGIIKTADKYGYPLHAVRISKTHFNLVCRLWPECKLEKSIRAFLCLFLRTCRESV